MNASRVTMVGAGVAAALCLTCSKEKPEGAQQSKPGSAAETESTKSGEAPGATKVRGKAGPGTDTAFAKMLAGKGGVRLMGERPEEALLDVPRERRLYSDRIEASSFLWVNYNRFQENYHANYIMDGDPKTAWIEGADANGLGEWVRIKTSPIAKASKIRLRIQNGYHKTERLFKQNARVRELEVKSLPSGIKKRFPLEDSMDWQELVLELSEERFEGVELKVLAAYEGTKYKDLCISDVQLYVTGKTPENPAFEAKKLERLQAWKKSRIDAAKIFAGVAAKELPIKSGYRVRPGTAVDPSRPEGEYAIPRGILHSLRSSAPPAQEQLFARAEQALVSEFKDWSHHRIVVKNPIKVPEVDGLVGQDSENLVYGWPSDAFVLPRVKNKSMLKAQSISLYESNKAIDPRKDGYDCRGGSAHAMRPPGSVGPNPRELVVWRCVEEEERDGVYTYLAWELYEFDDEGWLRLIVGPRGAQHLDWDKGEDGVILAGGKRLEIGDDKFSVLASKELTKRE